MSWPTSGTGSVQRLTLTSSGNIASPKVGDIISIVPPVGNTYSSFSIFRNTGSGFTQVSNTQTYTLVSGDIPAQGSSTGFPQFQGQGILGDQYTDNLVLTNPATVPGSPTIGTATASNSQISSTFTAPASNGGSAITNYLMSVFRQSDNALVGQSNNAASPGVLTGIANGVAVYCTFIAQNSVGNSAPSGASNVVTPSAATATLRQVATSTQAMNSFNASVFKTYSRSPHFMRSNISGPGVVVTVPAWFAVGGSPEAALASVTWTGSLEYPAGTFQQMTWSGATSVTITDGTERDCDPVPNIPPVGAKFWVRLFQQAAGGVCFFNFYAGDGTAQFVGGPSATDLTLGGGATVAGSGNASMVVPINIKGVSTDPAFGIGIDSIGVGRGDSSSGLPYQGYYERAFAPTYACGHFGSSGDTLANFLASHTRRLNMSTFYTHILLEGGINDITGGAAAATVATNYDAVVALFGGKPLASAALNPVTTSTDGWVTTANQTVVASNPVRITENTRRAAGTAGVKVFYNVNLQMEDVPSPENGITTAGYVSDGTHPNSVGAVAVANALNISLMLA